MRSLAVLAAILHLVYAAGWAFMILAAMNWENSDPDSTVRDWLVPLAALIFGIAFTQLVAVVKEHPWLVSAFVAVNVLTAVVLMWLLLATNPQRYTAEILLFGLPGVALPYVAWIATRLSVHGYLWRRPSLT